jgi:hypothetical protein
MQTREFEIALSTFEKLRGTFPTASVVSGTKYGSHQWSLNRALPPQSKVTFLIPYSVVASVSFGTKWSVRGGLLHDLGVKWTVFADSAPPRQGTLLMGSLNLTKRLHEKPL